MKKAKTSSKKEELESLENLVRELNEGKIPKLLATGLGCIDIITEDKFDDLPKDAKESIHHTKSFIITAISESLKAEEYRSVDKMMYFLQLAMKNADYINEKYDIGLHHSPYPESQR